MKKSALLFFLLFITLSWNNINSLYAQNYPCASISPLPYPETNICLQDFLMIRPDCCDIDFDVTCYNDISSPGGLFQVCEVGGDNNSETWDNCYDHALYPGVDLVGGGTTNVCGTVQPSFPPLFSCEVFLCCDPSSSCTDCDASCDSPPNDGLCPSGAITPYDGCLVEVILFDGACCQVEWDLCCQTLYNDISNATPDDVNFYTNSPCSKTPLPGKARYPCDDLDPNTTDTCNEFVGCINIPGLSIPTNPRVSLKLWLQGTSSGASMATHPNLPSSQPFNTAPWNYGGSESATPPANAVDWILLEARNTTNPTIIKDQAAGFLLSNGTIQDIDGTPGFIKFPNNTLVATGSYYIAIRTRNHLDVMSANTISVLGNTTYDFTTGPGQAYETLNGSDQNMMVEANGTGTGTPYALCSGDINGDGIINLADFNQYVDDLGSGGYQNADLNMSGNVDGTDFNPHLQPNNTRVSIDILRY